jgi:hypothetical protein
MGRPEIAKRFESLPSEALHRLHRAGVAITGECEAFDRMVSLRHSLRARSTTSGIQ